MITPQALMLGASILISLHSLNLAFIRRKLQLPITFILLELISIGISWIALTLPEHYLPFDTLQDYQKIIVIPIVSRKQSYQLPLASDLLEVHNHTSKFYFIIDSPKFIFSLLPTFEPL